MRSGNDGVIRVHPYTLPSHAVSVVVAAAAVVIDECNDCGDNGKSGLQPGGGPTDGQRVFGLEVIVR